MKALRFFTVAARTGPTILVIGLGMLIVTMVAQPALRADTATIFDAAADFSPTANPNGVWSYGFIPAGGLYTDFALYDLGGPAPDIPGLDAWRHTAGSSDPRVPVVAHNGGSSTLYAYGDLVLPPGEMHLHPGPEGQQTVVRFTAPFDGTFQIDVTFSVGDPPGFGGTTTTDVHVTRDGVSLFDGDVNGYASPTDSEHLSGLQTLAAGDIIDFTVGFGNGNYYFDTTFLDATISAPQAPTPPSVGGIVEMHVDGSDSSASPADDSAGAGPPYAAIAGGAAAAAFAIAAAGGWYARRRWLG
jgi:hypothetical protein